MLTVLLGAPGSGKTALTPLLRSRLHGWVVLDWDEFLPPVEDLTGRDIRISRDLWQPYRDLLRALVEAVLTVPVVMLGVSSPDDLSGWPPARWILLDCQEPERRRRLAARPADERDSAVADASEYRRLNLPVIDTTGRSLEEVVDVIIGTLTSE